MDKFNLDLFGNRRTFCSLGLGFLLDCVVFVRVAGTACAKYMLDDRTESGETLVEAGSDIDVQIAPSPQFPSVLIR